MTDLANALPPLAERPTLLGWMRKNLFDTWYNSLLSILAILFIYWAARGMLTWAFQVAKWQVIAVNLRLFIIGQYPIEQAWRLWVSMLLLAFLIGNSLGIWGRSRVLLVTLFLLPLALAVLPFGGQVRLWLASLSGMGGLGWLIGRSAGRALRQVVIAGWVIWMPIFILLIHGITPEGQGWMPTVASNLWGGLLLTLLLTIVGIVFSFPLGVLLALGRRSELPIIRWFSIGYIELVRGVPLVTILFMAQLMLPLFLPANVTIDRVLRAMVGITLFSAAYLAENVRGGLQAISKGQFEAAHALGLNSAQTMILIVLPQALRLVIPILVSQFIGLFKDTTLVSIVGLFDLLGIADTVLAQPEFLGLQREVYVFISVLYWVLSYAMSYASQRLEVSLGLGER